MLRCGCHYNPPASPDPNLFKVFARRDGIPVELITDIRTIFDRLRVDRIKRDDLVTRLVALEDRPWSEMPYTHKEMTAAQMRKLLKTLYVKIREQKFDGKTARGVLRDDFEALWDRYIPASPETECNPVTFAENNQKKV